MPDTLPDLASWSRHARTTPNTHTLLACQTIARQHKGHPEVDRIRGMLNQAARGGLVSAEVADDALAKLQAATRTAPADVEERAVEVIRRAFEVVPNGFGGTTTRKVEQVAPAVARKSGHRRNQYAAPCSRCGGQVAEGEGLLTGGRGAWVTTHEGECPDVEQRPTVVNVTAGRRAKLTDDGFYADPDTGSVYKVQRANYGSGNLYAKRLVLPTADEKAQALAEGRKVKGTWEYEPGLVSKLRPEWRMSTEEGAKWGQLYGFCCRCAAILEDEDSIARGMGPVCADKGL